MKQRKYIIREKTAWHIKIRLPDKTIYNKRINIIKYGGVKNSLKVAVDWRDEILKKYKLLDRLCFKKSPDFFKTNKQLVCIGVYFSIHHQKNGPTSSWIARCRIKNKEIKKHFSIKKYGYEKAFLKACEIRYQHCGPIRVLNKKLLPCKPSVPFIIL